MDKKHGYLTLLSMLTQMGIIMFIPVFICVIFGIYLDKMFEKAPLFLISFSFLGGGAALRNLYIYGVRQSKIDEKKKDDSKRK